MSASLKSIDGYQELKHSWHSLAQNVPSHHNLVFPLELSSVHLPWSNAPTNISVARSVTSPCPVFVKSIGCSTRWMQFNKNKSSLRYCIESDLMLVYISYIHACVCWVHMVHVMYTSLIISSVGEDTPHQTGPSWSCSQPSWEVRCWSIECCHSSVSSVWWRWWRIGSYPLWYEANYMVSVWCHMVCNTSFWMYTCSSGSDVSHSISDAGQLSTAALV